MAILRFIFLLLFSFGVMHSTFAQEREYIPGVTLSVEAVDGNIDSIYIYVDVCLNFR